MSFLRYIFSRKKNNNENLLTTTEMEADPSEHVNVELEEIREEDTSIPVDTENTGTISTFGMIKNVGSIFFAKENLPRFTTATMLTICNTGMNFLSPYLFGEIVKLLSSDDETTNIAGVEFTRETLILALVSSYSLAQVLPNLRDQIMVPVLSNITKKMVFKSTDHLLKKSLNYHVNTPFPDQVYLIQKSFGVSSVGTPLFSQIAPTMIEIIIACSVLSSRYGIEIGMGLFGLITTYTGYSAFTAKPIIKAREEGLKAGNEAYENFCNAINQYKNMYDFDKYEETIKGVDAALDRMIKADIKGTSRPLQFGVGHIGISRVSMLLGLLYVGLGVRPGKYSVEDFILLTGYLNQLSALLPAFGQAVNQLFASIPDMKFVFNELVKPDEVVDLYPDVKLNIEKDVPPSIEFDDVTFSYPVKPGEQAKPPVFKHLSFKIQPGQKVAFVSESGAGKTTAFNLLYRYYKLDSGTIKINGQDISTVSLKDLRKHIGLIDQKPNLFQDPIRGSGVRANILYGAEHPEQMTDEDIYNLAKQVNLNDFLQSLSDKLNTEVGEDGKKLSGGQQQKVSILRGLFKSAGIRLLDEITAPFDSQSATRVLAGMGSLLENVTCMMITHKLTEVKVADQIIVLDKGKAIACGTHDKLIQSCDLYQKLWKAYLKEESKDQKSMNSVTKLGITSSWDKDTKQEYDDQITITMEENQKGIKHN